MKGGAWCLPVALIFHSIILGVFIIGASIILTSNNDDTQTFITSPSAVGDQGYEDDSGIADLTPPPAITQDDHLYGSRDADIFLVEYSDLECPFCQSFHTTAEQIVDQYNGKVAWVYRHYPLSFHPNAEPAAQASECVAELRGNDAFWSYVKALFAEQSTALTRDGLIQNAVQVGANESNFVQCLDSDKYATKVQQHLTEGTNAGVAGTPHTFVVAADGKLVDVINGAQKIERVQSIIDASL